MQFTFSKGTLLKGKREAFHYFPFQPSFINLELYICVQLLAKLEDELIMEFWPHKVR